MNACAFWLAPDWRGGENLRDPDTKPFWMFDPVAYLIRTLVEKTTKPARWHTNRLYPCPTDLVVAMERMHEKLCEEKKDFSKYSGIENVIINSAEESARFAFGRKFKLLKPDKVFMWEGKYKNGNIHLDLTCHIKYGGLTNYLQDSSNFNKVFGGFIRHARKMINASFPDVTVGGQHSGYYKNNRKIEGRGYSATFYLQVQTPTAPPSFKRR